MSKNQEQPTMTDATVATIIIISYMASTVSLSYCHKKPIVEGLWLQISEVSTSELVLGFATLTAVCSFTTITTSKCTPPSLIF